MSTSIDSQPEPEQRVIECGLSDCERVGRKWTFQSGHCTREHWQKAEGRKALSTLKYSHARCFTCLSVLKDVEPPKPDWAFQAVTSGWTYNAAEDYIEMLVCDQDETRNSACGYQSLTPNATVDEKRVNKKTVTGAVCGQCGATDSSTHISLLADGDRTAARVAAFLTDADEDAFDAETLHREYRDTGDIEQAAGAAVLAER